MAHLTRDDVMARAQNTFNASGYIFDVVWWGSKPQVKCGIDVNGYGSTRVANKPYVATECSGWVSWCWGLPYKYNTQGFYNQFKGNSIARHQGSTFKDQFPGITYGDALWRPGHIILYMGSNKAWGASQTNWRATSTGHGMHVYPNGSGNFTLCLKYDSQNSGEYDPDDPDANPADDDFWDGGEDPITPPDLGDPEILAVIYGGQYTAKYPLYKVHRRF